MVTSASATFLTGIAHNFLAVPILAYRSWSSRHSQGDILPAFEGPQFFAADAVMSNADDGWAVNLDAENPYALTLLEQQVVDLLLAGLTGEEVGDLLAIDRRRVALCRSGAMRKYGARNGLHLAKLVSIARRSGLREQVVALEDVPSSIAV